MSWFHRFVVGLDRALFGRARSDLRWWQRRARRRGVRSVYNLAHSGNELEQVTQHQIELLFPIVKQHLRGDEEVVLDFGCGPGRFTGPLARLIGGRAIGVDPIARLLELAPSQPGVEYRLIRNGTIPVESASVDVAWICLVLMGITDPQALRHAGAELQRVLRPGGLVVLIENTESRPPSDHLRYRSFEEYAALMPWARLQPVSEYTDVGERITVMVGRAP